VLTADDGLAARIRQLRDHGSPRRHVHTEIGFNSRLDSLQAVVLSAKLRRLAAWNDARRAAAARYDQLLAGLDDVALPVVARGNEPVWHLYVVRVPERDRVLSALHAAGIGAGVHYPTPLHLTQAFAHLGYRAGQFPVAERTAGELLSLPIFPGISERQQRRIVDALAEALVDARR
jgi:dTDP-4-amino-4,6-dideoxygalactose transaminase